jgi:hypothetical protein
MAPALRPGRTAPLQWFSHVGTVDLVFARLGSWLDVGPQVFRATCHPQYAHPVERYVDGSFSIADDEVGLSVSGFFVR